MARVVIRRAGYGAMDGPVAEVLGKFDIPWRDKRVLVKPNMLGPFAPERGVTTHPSLVAAVVRWLEARGARVIVGDNAGIRGYAKNELSARVSGILEGSLGRYVNLGKETTKVPLESDLVEEVPFSRAVLECDLLVSLPKFKTHTLTQITGAIKNTFGHIPGAGKARLHARVPNPARFSGLVLDIFRVRPPDLTLMDGVVAMEGNGPSSDRLREAGVILASRDAVALDAIMAWMMGVDVGRVPMLKMARERGMGVAEFGRIEVDGPFERIPRFRMPSTFVTASFGFLTNRLLFPILKLRPVLDRCRCVRCGACASECPVGCIELDPFPRIDRGRCIQCYCCMEICPVSALKVGSRAQGLIRFLERLNRAKGRDTE